MKFLIRMDIPVAVWIAGSFSAALTASPLRISDLDVGLRLQSAADVPLAGFEAFSVAAPALANGNVLPVRAKPIEPQLRTSLSSQHDSFSNELLLLGGLLPIQSAIYVKSSSEVRVALDYSPWLRIERSRRQSKSALPSSGKLPREVRCASCVGPSMIDSFDPVTGLKSNLKTLVLKNQDTFESALTPLNLGLTSCFVLVVLIGIGYKRKID